MRDVSWQHCREVINSLVSCFHWRSVDHIYKPFLIQSLVEKKIDFYLHSHPIPHHRISLHLFSHEFKGEIMWRDAWLCLTGPNIYELVWSKFSSLCWPVGDFKGFFFFFVIIIFAFNSVLCKKRWRWFLSVHLCTSDLECSVITQHLWRLCNTVLEQLIIPRKRKGSIYHCCGRGGGWKIVNQTIFFPIFIRSHML